MQPMSPAGTAPKPQSKPRISLKPSSSKVQPPLARRRPFPRGYLGLMLVSLSPPSSWNHCDSYDFNPFDDDSPPYPNPFDDGGPLLPPHCNPIGNSPLPRQDYDDSPLVPRDSASVPTETSKFRVVVRLSLTKKGDALAPERDEKPVESNPSATPMPVLCFFCPVLFTMPGSAIQPVYTVPALPVPSVLPVRSALAAPMTKTDGPKPRGISKHPRLPARPSKKQCLVQAQPKPLLPKPPKTEAVRALEDLDTHVDDVKWPVAADPSMSAKLALFEVNRMSDEYFCLHKIVDDDGNTCLHSFFLQNQVAIDGFLVEGTYLIECYFARLRRGHYRLSVLLDRCNGKGQTPWMLAVMHGFFDVAEGIKRFLESGPGSVETATCSGYATNSDPTSSDSDQAVPADCIELADSDVESILGDFELDLDAAWQSVTDPRPATAKDDSDHTSSGYSTGGDRTDSDSDGMELEDSNMENTIELTGLPGSTGFADNKIDNILEELDNSELEIIDAVLHRMAALEQ